MVFCAAVLDVIFVSSECDHIFDFPSGADNTDTSPNEESVQRWALWLPQSTDENLHNVSEQVLTLLYSKKSLLKICKVGLLFNDPLRGW